MSFGCDFAASPPKPDALKRAGVRFVCRYLSTPGNPKNLTVGELVGCRAAGLDVVVVFETTAVRALGGQAYGVEDAKAAQEQLVGLGLTDAPVYFAVDFDAKESIQPTINRYFNGAASVLGVDRVGVYGGYWVVRRCLDARVCRYAWQTYAWSGGRWDPRAHIRQFRNGVRVAGIQVDLDESRATDFGQVTRPAPVSAVVRRRRLRAWVLARRAEGVSWRALKNTVKWRLWRRLGGR